MSGEENLSLRTVYRVTTADTDMYSRLRPSALLGFLIQSAIDSADHLGFGFGSLREQQLFWVLSRLTLEIDDCPVWHDEIEIETWPRDIEKIMYRRDFLIRKNGAIIGRATSSWLAIDINTKHPGKVGEGDQWKFVTLREKQAIAEAPLKLNALASGTEKTIEPAFNDFDINGHVTATHYLQWAENSLTTEFHRHHIFSGFTANYIKETLPGEQIVAKNDMKEPDELFFEATHVSTGNVSFRAKLRFTSMK